LKGQSPHHNPDIMHTEKNVFENIFNTVIDINRMTKDNIRVRMHIALFCHRKNIELTYIRSQVIKPKTNFALDKNTQLLVYQWLKSLYFPDGHSSNISRLVNFKDCKLYGMKSHNYHMFMQIFIPLVYRDLLLKGIWDALTEINHVFRDICSNKLQKQHMKRLETNIIQTMCKLEMIFPPCFFYSIKHLPVHLLFEAKVRGSVQYRCIYAFERLGFTHTS
jgi:hypothetical protein